MTDEETVCALNMILAACGPMTTNARITIEGQNTSYGLHAKASLSPSDLSRIIARYKQWKPK